MTITATAAPTTRLLAGFHELGRAARLTDHLDWYGPARLPGGDAEYLIRAIEEAGLTGRGGAGFPTARELRCAAAAEEPCVVLVDAADREPASAKDRLLLAVAPHLVIDGAVLAARAVGAREIVVCARSTAAVDAAVAERDRARLASVPIRACAVPGGYLAREETALINWINGGEPRPSPTRPHVGGVPTLAANAETYAHIALIARYGPEWFRSCGIDESPGTALFTVSGAVQRPGVVEAPTGTSVGALLRLAGGPSEPVQAILTGGYGGGWLPPALLEMPARPELFAQAGATLGPGIVVALPARACGLAESARVLAWLADQDLGTCRTCSVGLPAIAADFAALAAGAADPGRLRERLPGDGACRHHEGPVRFAASALRTFEPHLRHHDAACRELPPVLPLS